MEIQAVIFDLDGTLLNTLDDIADSANRVLRKAGLPEHPIDSYRYFVGEGLQKLVERIVPEEKRSRETIKNIIGFFREDYAKNWKNKTGLYDGIAGLLDGLGDNGIKLGVLSNKPHEFTVICVREFLGKWSFDVVLGQQEGRPRKPDPAGALESVRLLGVETENVLYVGDTATDMETARAAGMIPVGALWGFRTEKELRESGASHIVNHPRQVLELVCGTV